MWLCFEINPPTLVIPANIINKYYPFELSDKKFVKLFRINKPMSDELLDRLSPYFIQKNRSLDPEIKLFAALRFFASGSYQTDIGESRNIGISQASTSRVIHEVVNAVHDSGLFKDIIQFPSTIAKLTLWKKITPKFGP